MDAPAFSVADESWEPRTYKLPNRDVSAMIKRFVDFHSAKAAYDACYKFVYSSGGAIFLGNSNEVKPISARTMAEHAGRGEVPESDELFLEVVLIGTIDFDELLGFVDLHRFRSSKNHDVEKISRTTKVLLRECYALAPFVFVQIHRCCISVRYPNPLPAQILHPVIEKVLDFNEANFAFELSRNVWRKTFRESNGFSIGPG